MASDQLNLGGIVIDDFSILLAQSTSSVSMRNYDGLIGLGYGRYLTNHPTILESLKTKGLIDVANNFDLLWRKFR